MAAGNMLGNDPTSGASMTSSYNPMNPQAQAQYQQGLLGQEQMAQTAIEPAMLAANLQQSRFNSVFPYLEQQTNALSGQFGTTGSGTANTAGQPTISAAPVYNQQQIQQQVNATRAQNDQSMNTQNRTQQQQTAGMGYGSNSPLLQALQGQNYAANLGTNTQAEQQLRTTAAQQNAQQVLAGQTEQENQFAARQSEAIQRQKNLYGVYGSLLGSLGGLV
jgi:hypothetical protein